MQKMKVEYLPIEKISEFGNNARTHSESQVNQIANSIKEFGFNNPILVDEAYMVIAGHGRLAAAKQVGMEKVPVIRLVHLSERQRRAYILADNKLALNAGWDFEKLSDELSYLAETEFDLDLTGFAEDELDALLKADQDLLPDDFGQPQKVTVAEHQRTVPSEQVGLGLTEDDKTPEAEQHPVARKGDVFVLGDHRLMCGDSTNQEDVDVIVKRWQEFTGREAIHEGTGKTFKQLMNERNN